MPENAFAALALDVDAPRRMPLLHPISRMPLVDTAGRPGWIEIFSADSAVARAHGAAMADARMKAPAGRASAAALDGAQVQFLAALTASWHLVTPDGAALDVPCDAARAAMLYAEPGCTWIREQVDAFAGTRANYLPAAWQPAAASNESAP